MSGNGEHLHRDDYPNVVALLGALFDHRLDRAAEIGWQPSGHGAFVDWDTLLERSWLSTTERAVVQIARGVKVLERHGPPGSLTQPLRDCIDAVIGGRR